ncbi:UTP--glucose-1-phosphate uridylyltransferase [Halomonadaceae bacterium LMG 33818]|uniref:UTP--glucose-1-phosphate uridylyltransferase GalU n=1 Tax=Cernens ardua TaxID=3402176 RepID=UPI003EDBBFA1
MIRKAVLPVAGFGTRCLPASKAIPKEMITIVDKPVIQYVVQEAVAAGIKEIVLVTHSAKIAIENHFDKHFELEHQLEEKGKLELLEELRNIIPDDVTIVSVRQEEALGLGHAILCARPVIGDNEPFVVMLPDVLVDTNGGKVNDLAGMIQAFDETGNAQIMVENVPQDVAYKYGIVAIDGDSPKAGEHVKITGMVEKPKSGEEPSTLAVIGRYLLPGNIFPLLADTKPGAGGEIQLTDAIDELRTHSDVDAYRMEGDTYDCGFALGYLEATLSYGKRHPKLGDDFQALLKKYAGE